MTATNKSHEDLVNRGVFRKDPYDRMNVMELILSHLKNRSPPPRIFGIFLML